MDIKIIKGKGVRELNLDEQSILDRILPEHANKIERFSEISSIEVYIKDYKKEGKGTKERKYGIHLRAISPHPVISADAEEWDLAKCLHKSFIKLLNELEHKFHKSDQRPVNRKPQDTRERKK